MFSCVEELIAAIDSPVIRVGWAVLNAGAALASGQELRCSAIFEHPSDPARVVVWFPDIGNEHAARHDDSLLSDDVLFDMLAVEAESRIGGTTFDILKGYDPEVEAIVSRELMDRIEASGDTRPVETTDWAHFIDSARVAMLKRRKG